MGPNKLVSKPLAGQNRQILHCSCSSPVLLCCVYLPQSRFSWPLLAEPAGWVYKAVVSTSRLGATAALLLIIFSGSLGEGELTLSDPGAHGG